MNEQKKILFYEEGFFEKSIHDYDLKDTLKKIILKEMKILFSIRPLVNIHVNRVQ